MRTNPRREHLARQRGYQRQREGTRHDHTLAWAAGGAALGAVSGWSFEIFGPPTTAERIGNATRGAVGFGLYAGGNAWAGHHGYNPWAIAGVDAGAVIALAAVSTTGLNKPLQIAESAAVLGAIGAGIGHLNRP